MAVFMDELNDIVYRGLFSMDRRALLIHLNLPADTYVGDDDDELLDHVGTMALNAIIEVHIVHTGWLDMQPPGGIAPQIIKSMLRTHVRIVGDKYKARAKALGVDLLTTMKL